MLAIVAKGKSAPPSLIDGSRQVGGINATSDVITTSSPVADNVISACRAVVANFAALKGQLSSNALAAKTGGTFANMNEVVKFASADVTK